MQKRIHCDAAQFAYLPTSALKNPSKRHKFIRDMYSFMIFLLQKLLRLSPHPQETPKPTNQTIKKFFLKIQIPKTQCKELTNQTKIPHECTNEIAKKKNKKQKNTHL